MGVNMKAKNLFDAQFYISEYSDVAASGIDPFTHYSLFGWKENRDPNVFFSTRYIKQPILMLTKQIKTLLNTMLNLEFKNSVIRAPFLILVFIYKTMSM